MHATALTHEIYVTVSIQIGKCNIFFEKSMQTHTFVLKCRVEHCLKIVLLIGSAAIYPCMKCTQNRKFWIGKYVWNWMLSFYIHILCSSVNVYQFNGYMSTNTVHIYGIAFGHFTLYNDFLVRLYKYISHICCMHTGMYGWTTCAIYLIEWICRFELRFAHLT